MKDGSTRVLVAPPTKWATVERKAVALIGQVAPDCLEVAKPLPMLSLFEGGFRAALGIEYGIEHLADEEAYYNAETNEIVLDEKTYQALVKGDGRARFTTAHEVGHAVLHRKYIRGILRDKDTGIFLRRSEVKPYQQLETQAHVFASEFLMPSKHVVPMILKGWTAEMIADHFVASLAAAQVKVDRLSKGKSLQLALGAFL